jgi:putative OPT family oligopeptide transporter
MTVLAMSGGLLGILFMIPLRTYLIEREHGRLPYPEGTACAEVLRATEVGGGRAMLVFGGLGLGALFRILTEGLRVVPAKIGFFVPWIPKAHLCTKVSSALFGVGFILGPRIATIMVSGGLLSSLILIPAIAIWGADRGTPLYPETELLIPDMSYDLIWNRYVRYIGAGAVACAGVVTLIRSIPTMIESFRVGTAQLKGRLGKGSEGNEGGEPETTPRTKRDLSLAVVGIGVAAIVTLLIATPGVFGGEGGIALRAVAAASVAVCAFFFVTVSSRIVGLVGVTSNPTSGMTIASLIATASVVLVMGWTDTSGKVAALTVGCVIAIAASIAGDTSQDLKTGFLLGATPKRQQIGELVGVLTSATAVCATVLMLHETYGFGSTDLPAPQATLMKIVIEGVLEQSLPWTLVGIGVVIALIAEFVFKVPSLAFAVGVYLPVETMVPVFLGGGLRGLLERFGKTPEDAAAGKDRGVLLGSGLVGGSGLTGVGIAGMAAYLKAKPEGIGTEWAGSAAPFVSAGLLGLLALIFVRICRRPSSD